MNIRTKLTLRFIAITAIILISGLLMIYIFSAAYRQDEFYTRLQNKAINTATLFIDVDEVNTALLTKIEKDNPINLPSETILIYNAKDSLLFATGAVQAVTVTDSMLSAVRTEDEIRSLEGEHEVLGFVFTGKRGKFVIIAAAIDIYGHKKLKNLLIILMSVFGVSVIVVTITAWLYAGKALQPIANVVNQVSKISISSLDKRLDEGNGSDEIAKLSHTFNDMLIRLESSFLTQKNFIANASHELRTPLTSITGQLEVTLLNERSPEKYKQVILSVLEDIKSLNLLSNKLLLLAQSSMEERERKMQPIRIDEVIWQAKEELLKYQEQYIVNVNLDETLDDEQHLTIIADEQLIKTAVTNMMENSCKYADDHRCEINISPSKGGVKITFVDNGIGIPHDELQKIFEPFFRGSNTLGYRGHGIGLSMVRRILLLHKGSIAIASEVNKGTTIAITLPCIG
ncbi:HAMP domain-containing sensor histidine kinase [Pseudochryseolinea flava]|uniref:histidine kinase n=1 Tax=Pseudochryseolinea flava TaxID=2059302 RepID=A0A364Y066_9BACT|nr:ATP-binding protein [Pseudochryseolinea flava]RAV99987.1 two-component sensor histidine kinase [Pseudochryseolinea flava]